MEKDTAFVPVREGEVSLSSKIAKLFGHAEDAPLYTFGQLALHQLLGWQAYLLTYASGGKNSTPQPLSKYLAMNSHFNPASVIFTRAQSLAILITTLGICATVYGLYAAAGYIGAPNVMLLYGVPYLWVNNWIGERVGLH